MTTIESNLTILLIAMVIFLFSISVFNTVICKIKHMPVINAQNNNVSTSEILEWIKELKIKLELDDFNVIYRENYIYTNFLNAINKKKKTITIPKWDFNSVGYEIDYLFAFLWTASLVNKKDKLIKWINLRLIYLLMFLKLVFIICFVFQMIYWYGVSNKTHNFYLKNLDVFYWYDRYYIFQLLAITSFLIIIFLYLSDVRAKKVIERRYEIFIKPFVEEYAIKYLDDLVAARIYSISNTRLNISTIYFIHKSTKKLMYFSPFTFQ